MYVAQTLMPEGVGRVAYAQNVASYFVTAAALGIPTVGLRAIAIHRDNRAEMNKVFSELFILNAISTCITLLLYFVLIVANPVFKAELPLYCAVGISIAFNLINIDWLFQGNEEYVYIVVRSIAVKVLSLVALFIFVKEQTHYVAYAVITSLATCGNYLFNILRSRKYVRLKIHGLDLKQHIRPVMLFAGSLLFGSIYSKVDTTMLGVMAGEESVGYYSYAHKVLQIGVSFCTAITSAFLPRLSYCFQNDRAQFDILVRQAQQIIAYLAIPAATGLFILSQEVIQLLFGEAFLPAAQTLSIFTPLIVIYAFGNLMCYQMMICSGNEKTHVKILATAAGINVLLNALLIPRMKQNGAAIASVCTELFINVFESICFARKLRLHYDLNALWQAIVGTCAMSVSILLLKCLMKNPLLSFICSISVGIITYVSMNILIRNQLTMDVLAMLKKKIVAKTKNSRNHL